MAEKQSTARPQPTFEGKTLLEWLEAIKTGPTRRRDGMEAARKLASKTKGVVPDVIGYLQHGRTRYVAVYALGMMKKSARDALPTLLPLLNDDDDSNRHFVADALASIGGSEELVDVFLRLLQDPYAPVRRDAADGLGRLGASARRAIPNLIAALDDSQILDWAAVALGRFGIDAQDAVPKLIELLNTPAWGPEIRKSIVEALGRIATPAAIDAVQLVVDDSQQAVRTAARKIIYPIQPAK
jgi:HEAT repeat protein